jgi:hypothetical protein
MRPLYTKGQLAPSGFASAGLSLPKAEAIAHNEASLQERPMATARQTDLANSPELWPELPLNEWKDTYATLHMWTQIVGKIRLKLTPRMNQWWNVPLYVSSRGLSTSLLPYGNRHFEMEFDFLEHKLAIHTTDARAVSVALAARPVADFYAEVMTALRALDIDVHIWKIPVEVADPIPFDQDRVHASYDREYARRFWRILVSVDEVFKIFRARFIGKSSPVHFFWGSFDLAVTRFSGRPAPERTETDPVMRKIMEEAYSHEVISAGWWPGGGTVPGAAFYCYAAPAPGGFEKQSVGPAQAHYDSALGEYLLMYDEVRVAPSPSGTLLEFLQSTYEAGATTGNWDRKGLERSPEPSTP